MVLDNYDKLLGEDDDLRYELVYGCLRLFEECDINGDGGMEWAEFMQFIIDAVSSNSFNNQEDSKSKKVVGRKSLM